MKGTAQKKPQGSVRITNSQPQVEYERFEELDGSHDFAQAVPEGRILYEAIRVPKARVLYFNFNLAKEMGLIRSDHKEKLNKDLKNKIIETFSLRIINEYDREQNIIFPKQFKKPNSFMATRYLQLQHVDKTGKTSGDGRSIWNGQIENKGQIWDVSSRGTGVTALAPGLVKAGKNLPSGCEDFGYSCGLAEIDELLASALMAESIFQSGVNSERVLAIIDHGDGLGVGVRAGKNLFRPAHMFQFLKQKKYGPLKKVVDFFIDRQFQNGETDFSTRSSKVYQKFLRDITIRFAKFAAQLDRNYLFVWLDWDGDNVLADAGIIDYGSIRPLGLRHDQYRYDDVERFSTNLNEQKNKARLTIQVFAQLTHFLESKDYLPVAHFKDSSSTSLFDKIFQSESRRLILKLMGLNEKQIIRCQNLKEFEYLIQLFLKIEAVKTSQPLAKVPDGVNRPAILDAKLLFHLVPESLAAGQEFSMAWAEEVYRGILSSTAPLEDQVPSPSRKNQLIEFAKAYSQCARHLGDLAALEEAYARSRQEFSEEPITGNAFVYIIELMMQLVHLKAPESKIQNCIDFIIKFQKNGYFPETTDPELKKFVSACNQIIYVHRHDI